MVENRIDEASDRSGPGDLAVDIGLNKLGNFNLLFYLKALNLNFSRQAEKGKHVSPKPNYLQK